jgi:hypothetical protein
VLSHDQRIALGAPVETVDAEAKDLAAKQLARHAARKAVKTADMVKPKPTSAPTTETQPETPKQLEPSAGERQQQ